MNIIFLLIVTAALFGQIDLFGDPIARNVGDLITVQIIESSSAQSQTSLKNSQSEGNAISSSGTGALSFLPAIGVDFENGSDFNGGGQTSRKGSVQATITARVIERLDNGNLVIEGKKKVDISGEESYVMISGVVRPYDISRNNYVRSDRIGELAVSLKGRGEMDRQQKKSLIGRLLGWVF